MPSTHSAVRRPGRPGPAIWASAVLVLSGAALQGQQKGPAPAKAGPPAALIVAMDRYDKLPPLKYPVRSGVKLAKSLSGLGYRVTVLTEPDSAGQARESLKGVAGVTVAEPAATSGAIDAAVRGWIAAGFGDGSKGPAAPYGFVVFGGHGEEREANGLVQPYFMAKEDGTGAGGMDVDAVRELVGKKGLPLAFILDICRVRGAKADGRGPGTAHADAERPDRGATSPSSDRAGPARGSGFSVRGPAEATKFAYPTTLFSTLPGRPAEDTDHDLLDCLADGLEVKDGRFVGRPRFAAAQTEDEKIIRLFDWFSYGVQRAQAAAQLRQTGCVDGWNATVGQRTIVAELKGEKAAAPRTALSAVDVLGQWHPEYGAFQTDRRRAWVTITRPPQIAPNEAYVDGRVETPVGVANRQAVIEVFAEGPAAKGAKPLPVAFEFHAKHQSPGAPDPNPTYLSVGRAANSTLTARPNDMARFVVPLAAPQGQELNRVAFAQPTSRASYWPSDYSLTVLGVTLTDAANVAAVDRLSHASGQRNLLARWWPHDRLPGAEPVVASVENAGSRSVLRIAPGNTGGKNTSAVKSCCGGAVYPAVYAPKGWRIQVELQVPQTPPGKGGSPARDAQVTVQLSGDGAQVATVAEQKVRAGQSTRTLVTSPLTQAAAVDYLWVESSGPIEIARVGITP